MNNILRNRASKEALLTFLPLLGFCLGLAVVLTNGYIVAGMVIVVLCGPYAFRHPSVLVYLFVASIPFDGIAVLENISISRFFGVLSLAGFFLLTLTRKTSIKWSKIDVAILLYFFVSIPSYYWATDKQLAFDSLTKLSQLVLSYLIISNYITTIEKTRKMFLFYLVGCVISTIFALKTGMAITKFGQYRLYGAIGDPNEFVEFIGVILAFTVFSFHQRRSLYAKLPYLLAIILIMTATMLSGSRAGLIWLILFWAGMFWEFGSVKKKLFMICTSVVVVVLVISYLPGSLLQRYGTIRDPMNEKGISVISRVTNYTAAIKMFSEHPFGIGIRNFLTSSQQYGAYQSKVAHNTYLEILTGQGVQGFIPFAGVICLTIGGALKYRRLFPHTEIPSSILFGYLSLLFLMMFLSSDLEKITFLFPAIVSGLLKGSVTTLSQNTLVLKNE